MAGGAGEPTSPSSAHLSRALRPRPTAAPPQHATRAVMEEAGRPTPRNMLITSADMLDKVGGSLGWVLGGCAVRWKGAQLARAALPFACFVAHSTRY